MADMDKKEMEAAVESHLVRVRESRCNIDRICVALAIDRPAAEQRATEG